MLILFFLVFFFFAYSRKPVSQIDVRPEPLLWLFIYLLSQWASSIRPTDIPLFLFLFQKLLRSFPRLI